MPVAQAQVESCAICHDGGRVADITPMHALTGKIAVSNQAAAVSGSDAVVTFTIKVDGAAATNFVPTVSSRTSSGVTTWTTSYFYNYDGTTGQGTRTGVSSTTSEADALSKLPFENLGGGNYRVTFTGAAPAAGAARKFVVRVDRGAGTEGATVVAEILDGSGKPTYLAMSDQACKNCHGERVFRGETSNGVFVEHLHHGVFPEGPSACVNCHVTDSSSRGTKGDRLMAYVHGIHNSHSMPERTLGTAPNTVVKPEGVYARNDSTNTSNWFSIGFPGEIRACNTCHNTEENLAKVLAKPVTFSTCMSCHDSWDGFPLTQTGQKYDFHRGYTAETACTSCHKAAADGGVAFSQVGDIHGERAVRLGATAPTVVTSVRGGLLWGGKDQAVELAGNVKVKIDEIVATGVGQPLKVKWSAKKLEGGVEVAADPCNLDVNAGPVFLGLIAPSSSTPKPAGQNVTKALADQGVVSSNFQFLRAYAQGNDWVNAGVGTSPGQPGSTVTPITQAAIDQQYPPVTTGDRVDQHGNKIPGTLKANTTCASNVATTDLASALETTATAKGIVALQGRPQIKFTDSTWGTSGYTRYIMVRSPTATREFLTATGALPAAKAATAAPSPNDARRKLVDTAKCLKCHSGTLYQHGGNRIDNVDLCVMCHNPASNEKNNRLNMGVEASETYDRLPGQTYNLAYMLHAIHSAGETNVPLVYYRTNGVYAFGSEAAINALPNWPGAGCFDVFGSSQSLNATGNPASTGSQCDSSAAGPTVPAKKTHNEIVVHYPRPLNDCGACHTDGALADVPDQRAAVAVTAFDAGASPWGNQLDDVLMGPVAASCTSCHRSNMVKSHAFEENGWVPSVFEGGRQSLLDVAK